METRPRFFFQSPHNRPSGGTKVIHRIARLLDHKGYQSFVVSPQSEATQADWMEQPHTILPNEAMKTLCGRDDIIVGCWPDRETSSLIRDCPANTKVYFPQSNFTLRGKDLVGTEIFDPHWGYTHFWAVSHDNKKILDQAYGINCHVVHPYFFEAEWYQRSEARPERKILALGRKGKKYVDAMYRRFKDRIPFTILEGSFTEDEFIKIANHHQFFLHTPMGLEPNREKQLRAIGKYILTFGKVNRIQIPHYAGSKYDEAFPLPPAEATLAGCVPIGFAKNGDLEWMNDTNSFIAQDRSFRDLSAQIELALLASQEKLNAMNASGVRPLGQFSPENTLTEVQQFLKYAYNT